MFRKLLSFLCIYAFCLSSPAAQATSGDITNSYTTNGDVYSVVHDDQSGTTYIGGSFTEIGSAIGTFATVDPTGQMMDNGYEVVGTIYDSVSDGAGGFYLAGDFSFVKGVARDNLAHILPNGNLDQNWAPNPNGEVRSIALDASNNILYIGGDFTKVQDVNTDYLAAINAQSGQLVTNWLSSTNKNADGIVNSLLLDSANNKLYVGGSFTAIAEQSRGKFAAIDISSGQLHSNWGPDFNNAVHSFALDSNILYVGGSFTGADNSARLRIAAIDVNNGQLIGNWNPQIDDGIVYSMALRNNSLYIGGTFSSITTSSGTENRFCLAAINKSNGNLKIWNPTVINNGNNQASIRSIAVNNNAVYVGGNFTQIGVVNNNSYVYAHNNNIFNIEYLAAINVDPNNPAVIQTNWNPNPNSVIYSIKLSGNNIIIGGENPELMERNYLAAIDSSGNITDWNPNLDSNVYAMTLDSSASKLYVGGDFTKVNGNPFNKLAKIDTSSNGAADSGWKPNPDSTVYAMVLDSSANKLYVGGSFTKVNGSIFKRLAKIDTSNGSADAEWNPNLNDSVLAMALDSSTNKLYVGGSFTKVNGSTFNRLAKIDTSSGVADSNWKPNFSSTVLAMALDSSTNKLYVGGSFTKVNGNPFKRLAKIDTSSGVADSGWNPNPNSYVYAMALDSSRDELYVGGDFTKVNGNTFKYLAKIDTDNGVADSNWKPNLNYAVSAMALDSSRDELYVGGNFTKVNGSTFNKLAKIDTDSGVADSNWKPKPNHPVHTMALNSSTGKLYVGEANLDFLYPGNVLVIEK